MVGILDGFFFLDVFVKSFLCLDFIWKWVFGCFLLFHRDGASISDYADLLLIAFW